MAATMSLWWYLNLATCPAFLMEFAFMAESLLGPFPLTQIVALIWVAIRIATQISATIYIFMCGDRKVAIISAILIAIRAPLIVSLFENNRDYFQIIATIFCAKCVRTVNENRTGFLYPIMQGGRSVLDKQWRLLWHQQWAIVGYAHSAHGYAISAQNITTFLKYFT